MKPFSQACENNKQPILEAIKPLFKQAKQVLEIGSGTGQHAVYFALQLPHVTWLTSDRQENIEGIKLWIEESESPNIEQPLVLDVTQPHWEVDKVDGVFSANTAHIMHMPEVEKMFEGIGQHLKPGGFFALYGPFNYNNSYTSTSNQQFDVSLRSRDPGMGLKNVEDLIALGAKHQLEHQQDIEMPANNRLLVFQKVDSAS